MTESVRSRLTRAAAELTYRNGVTATGVEAIAARAGVAKMSLYRHFPGGKDELITAALDRYGEAYVGPIRARAAQARPGSPAAAVELIFDTLDTVVAAPRWRGCPFLKAAAELPAGHPAHRAVADHHRQLRAEMATQLGRGGLPSDTADDCAQDLLLLVLAVLTAGTIDQARDAAARTRSMARLVVAARAG